MVRKVSQQEIKKCASESATYLLLKDVDLHNLSFAERDVLWEITYHLFVKFYNGRSLRLLTTEYFIAEAIDIVREYEEKIEESELLYQMLVQIALAFEKFIKEFDGED